MGINPSIYDLEPLETGGTFARTGFLYQDHIGVGFCLEMVDDEELLEIWFETLDDMTFIWQKLKEILVEFVQVKQVDRPSRWSIAALAERENNKVGTSLLEKSLNHSRCREKTCFRLVTSYDVDSDLKILKSQRSDSSRLNDETSIGKIIEGLIERLGEIKSPNNVTIRDWVKRCYWKKMPEDVGLIKLLNLSGLEKIAKSRNQYLNFEHRDEIYGSLLAIVVDASTTPFKTNRKAKIVENTFLNKWLDDKFNDARGGEPVELLERKLRKADLSDEVRRAARVSRLDYLKEKLTNNYDDIRQKILSEAEGEVAAMLLEEISKLEAGLLDLNGVEFHAHCLEKINAIAAKINDSELRVTKHFLQGYMYDRTARGVHKFTKA